MNNIDFSASRMKIRGFSDLFSSDDDFRDTKDVRDIPISQLYDFKEHPFKVKDDARMAELVESIKENGVLTPGIARVRDAGGYEIIAGHSRKRACELAGINTMPFLIRNLSDDEAVIVMVDSNIQRDDVLPSEKAKAYRLKYDAMKNRGTKGDSFRMMEEASGENWKTIQRYIWLTRLSDEFLNMMDDKKLKFIAGVNLSFLDLEEQGWVMSVIEKTGKSISTKQSGMLKNASTSQELTESMVWEIITGNESKKGSRKITISSEKLDKYFSEDYTEDEIERIITILLERWAEEEGR